MDVGYEARIVDPKFSARLPRVARAAIGELNAVAAWLGASRGPGPRLAALLGGEVVVTGVALARDTDRDRFAAACEVRVDGATVTAWAAGAFARVVAQRLLGGPDELAAPRPVTIAERAIWTLVVAAALADLGVAGQAYLALDDPPRSGMVVAVDVDVVAEPVTVWLDVPRGLATRLRRRELGAWTERTAIDVVVAVARCAVATAALAALAVGDIVTVEGVAGGVELAIGTGAVAVSAAPGAVVGTVATEYVPRDMAIADDAHLELVVALGTTQLSLRQLAELAVGQVVPLGRPLAGPYELRAGGRVLGRGELVDIDGELGVRVVSLGDSP
jgi:flagellar motor switch/type III secretory pathway protein FliN